MKNSENQPKDKHVKISADRHQQLKLLSAKEGRDMRDIINDAFDYYVNRHKSKGG